MNYQQQTIKKKKLKNEPVERLTQAALKRIREKNGLRLLSSDELADISYIQPERRHE